MRQSICERINVHIFKNSNLIEIHILNVHESTNLIDYILLNVKLFMYFVDS